MVLQACASVSSEAIRYKGDYLREYDPTKIGDGVVYYMPKRPIRIQYKIQAIANEPEKVNVTFQVSSGLTDTIPDEKNMFLLRYSKNYVGRNNMKMAVDQYGLLSVSHSNTLSRAREIAKNLGASAAAIMMGAGYAPSSPITTGHNEDSIPSAASIPAGGLKPVMATNLVKIKTAKTESCTPQATGDSSSSILINPDETLDFPKDVCGIKVSIKRDFDPIYTGTNSKRLESENWLYWIYNQLDVLHWQKSAGNSLPGVFYRQELPYIVTITSNNEHYDFTALSPNESGVYFAPISKTLFSDNTSDITLADGIVYTLEEKTDSEALGLSYIPADALGAFTGSVGGILGQLRTNTDNQTTLLNQQNALATSLARQQACDMAVAANPLAGKQGSELTAALANITAACPAR